VKGPIAAVILAAGASRRLGQAKQLVRYGNETLLERTIRVTRDAGVSDIFVVLGAQRELISATIAFKNAEPVFNENWEKGIASSIHAGLRELDARGLTSSSVLIVSCDQPRLTAHHLKGLIGAFAAQDQASIAASSYAGTLGVPALFPRAAFPQLLALRGDKGARALLLDPPCPVIAVPFAGGEIDIDVPADLEHLS
jgi:CTP:molybdopterin cytidylyltransferase MocA